MAKKKPKKRVRKPKMSARIKKNLKKIPIPIGLEIVIIILIFVFDYLNQYVLRDYFIIIFALTIVEAVCRFCHEKPIPFTKKKKCINFILCWRQINLNNLLNMAKGGDEETRKTDEYKEEMKKTRKLTESSLSMLGLLTGLTLTLVILALSFISQPSEPLTINQRVLAISGLITFIIFVIDLALCYSLLAPMISDKTIIKGVKKYYCLTMAGLVMLGTTFIWGIYTYDKEFFHIEKYYGQISLALMIVFLIFLYSFAYVTIEKCKGKKKKSKKLKEILFGKIKKIFKR